MVGSLLVGAVIGVAVGEAVRIIAPGWTKQAHNVIMDLKNSVVDGFKQAKKDQPTSHDIHPPIVMTFRDFPYQLRSRTPVQLNSCHTKSPLQF